METFIKKILKLFGINNSNSVYLFLSNTKRNWRKRINNKKLHTVGMKVLVDFDCACKEAGVSWWLEYGTLLGAYRNNAFIEHDIDLDCGIFKDQYNLEFEDVLLKYGFQKIKAFYVINAKNEKVLSEVALLWKNTFKIDVFLSSQCDTLQRSVKILKRENNTEILRVYEDIFPLPFPLSKVKLYNREFNSPGDAAKYLEIAYGKSFMIPNKQWDYTLVKKKYDFDIFYGIAYIF